MKDSREGLEVEERPTPDQIYELVEGGWKAHILKTAINLDVFSTIAEGLHTVEKIAASKGWKARPTRLLLDSLCPLGLLTKKSGNYLLTPVSEAFLVSSSETYGGGYVLTTLATDTWQQLSKAVRTGKRQIPHIHAVWEQDAALESVRTPRIAQSLEMWRTIGIDPDTKQDIKVLDMASGCGIKSYVLAQRNPNAKITCVDWAGVLQVAEKLADKWGILKQVNFRAGDLMTMDLGDSEYDVVLLGQITYYWSPDQNIFVLGKVYRALAPGGLVVIHAPMADEERCSSESLMFAVVMFLFSEKGDIYTFSECKAMLEEAGFSQITKHSNSLISARK